MAAVVVSFIASTAVAQLVESKSAKEIDDIVGNAMPSVQLLALVRGDLRDIDRDISDRTAAAPHLAELYVEKRRNIDAAIAAYLGFPFFPGERAMFAPVPDLLRTLDRQVGSARELDEATIAGCRQTIDAIDRALQRGARLAAPAVGVISTGPGSLFWVELPKVTASRGSRAAGRHGVAAT